MYLTKNIFGLCWCVVCLFEFEWHTPLVQTYQHTRWMPRSAYFLRGPAHMFLEYVWQIFGKHYLCIVEDTGCKYIFTCHPNKCLASFPRCPKYLVDYIYIYIYDLYLTSAGWLCGAFQVQFGDTCGNSFLSKIQWIRWDMWEKRIVS